MDTLTHTVLGACTGELIAGKKLGKKAMLVGALVNNLPDLDMIANLWHSQASALLSHRGITHSFFFAVFATPLLIWLLKKWFAHANLSKVHWLILVGHGLILHILLDSCTTYGTGLFEPFSGARISFNVLFILDLFILLPLLFAAIWLLVVKGNNTLRTRLSGTFLIYVLVYILFSLFAKFQVNRIAKNEISSRSIPAKDFISSPGPFTSLLWYTAIRDSTRFYVGYYSLFDKQKRVELQSVAKNDSLLDPVRSDEDVMHLLRFTQGYYVVTKGETGLQLSDVRFGPNIPERNRNIDFVFRFDVVKMNGKWQVSQAPFRNAESEDLKKIFKRIGGFRD